MATSSPTSTTGILGYAAQVSSLYYQFLSYFPTRFHGVVSLALAILLVYAVFKVIKRNFIYIIVLILLLPQAGPMFKTIWENVLQVLQFLIKR